MEMVRDEGHDRHSPSARSEVARALGQPVVERDPTYAVDLAVAQTAAIELHSLPCLPSPWH
jgi:hypothetical protein